MYSLSSYEQADAAAIVKRSAQHSLKHASNPKEWIFDGYAPGLKGYDNWIAALETGGADAMGDAYNAGVERESCQHAASILREAKERLAGVASAELDAAIAAYAEVASDLEAFCDLYPWRGDLQGGDVASVDEASSQGVEVLTSARAAEERGLQALERLIGAL
jgi:hypothetical protein